MPGGKWTRVALSGAPTRVTRRSKRSITSSKIPERPYRPSMPDSNRMPFSNRLSSRLAASNVLASISLSQAGVETAHQHKSRGVGQDAVVGDHDRCGGDVSQMSSDAEGVPVLVAEYARYQHGQLHDRHGLGACGNLQRIDLGSEADGGQSILVALCRIEAVDSPREMAFHLLKEGRSFGQPQAAGRQAPLGLLARRLLDEGLRPIEGIGCDAEPGCRPIYMRACQHGLRGDLGKGPGKDLVRLAGGDQMEAIRTGATHA